MTDSKPVSSDVVYMAMHKAWRMFLVTQCDSNVFYVCMQARACEQQLHQFPACPAGVTVMLKTNHWEEKLLSLWCVEDQLRGE